MDKSKYTIDENAIKNQRANKRKKICIITCIFIAFVGLIIFSIVDSNRKAKLEEERLKKVFEEENKVIMNIVTPVAEFYKLTDIKYDHLEVNSLNGIVYLKTDKYDELSNEEKLLFLTALASAVYLDNRLFPVDSEASNKYMDFKVVTSEHEYSDFTSDGSWLLEDGKEIFRMKTEYSSEVNSSLNEKLKDSSYSKCSGGAVGCRSGFHPCNPNKNNYCVSCCKSN